MADSVLGHAASPTVASPAFRASRDNNAKTASLTSNTTVTMAKANSSSVRLLANNASLLSGVKPSPASATTSLSACKKKKSKVDVVVQCSSSKVTSKTIKATASSRPSELDDSACSTRSTQKTSSISNRLLKQQEPEEMDEDEEEEEEESIVAPAQRQRRASVNDEKKRRRSDRYDSSESSDSGVASLVCSDASSWSSSSDITEPVSPASPASSQPSPVSQPPLETSSTTNTATTTATAVINHYHNNNNNSSSNNNPVVESRESDSTNVNSTALDSSSSLQLDISRFCINRNSTMILTSTPIDEDNSILLTSVLESEFPNGLKRRRRYSESFTSTETQSGQVKGSGNDSTNSWNQCSKRPRRMSSQQSAARSTINNQSAIDTSELNSEKTGGSPEGATGPGIFNKVINYLWPKRNNNDPSSLSQTVDDVHHHLTDKDEDGEVQMRLSCSTGRATRSSVKANNHRLSWPLSKQQQQQPNGQQLKITEFFPTQVKHSWSYSKLPTSDLKQLQSSVDLQTSLKTLDVVPSESRVAIVSVAHVDHRVDTNYNLHTSTSPSGAAVSITETTSTTGALISSTSPGKERNVALHCSPPVAVNTPQIRFPAINPPSSNGHRNHNKAIASFSSSNSSCAATSVTASTAGASNGSSSAPTGVSCDIQCLWQHCTANLAVGQSLLEHIQSAHVASQAAACVSNSSTSSSSSNASTRSSSTSSPVPDATTIATATELYACQWEGCKFQGKTSSSRAWLEEHVAKHCGHKPFHCIYDKCEQRFNSQVALSKHAAQCKLGDNSGNGLRRENGQAKMLRRNSKKQKNRRSKVAPAKLMDFFDAGVMERLRHQLLNSRASQNRIGLSSLSPCLTVHSQILARRLDTNGKSRVLVRWTPHDVELPDQWMLDSEVVKCKTVPLHDLSNDAQIRLNHLLHRPSEATTTAASTYSLPGFAGPTVGRFAPKQRRK